MSGRDDESCNIMQHHATSCNREQKRVGSRWHKMSFDQRRCGRETRWRERKAGGSRKRKRKTGDRRKRKGFPLQFLPKLLTAPECLQAVGLAQVPTLVADPEQ